MSLIEYDPAAMQTAITNGERSQALLMAKGPEFAAHWSQIGPAFTGATAAGAAAIHEHICTAHVQGADAIGGVAGQINVADMDLGSADAGNAASRGVGGARR